MYLYSITRAQIIENLRHIPCAPSVQMQEVPRDYTSSDDEEDDEDYDVRIPRKCLLRPTENNRSDRLCSEIDSQTDFWDITTF